MATINQNLVPAIPVGYLPFINRYLHPGRSLLDDPVSNQLYRMRIEEIQEDVLCTQISPPTITTSVVEIRQNNSVLPRYVPVLQTIGTLTLTKVISLGDAVSTFAGVTDIQRPSGNVPVRNAFSDWVKQITQAREVYGSRQTSEFRRTIEIQLMDSTGTVAAHWKAYNCIPVQYTPFVPW